MSMWLPDLRIEFTPADAFVRSLERSLAAHCNRDGIPERGPGCKSLEQPPYPSIKIEHRVEKFLSLSWCGMSVPKQSKVKQKTPKIEIPADAVIYGYATSADVNGVRRVSVQGRGGPMAGLLTKKGAKEAILPSATIVGVSPDQKYVAWDGEHYVLRPTIESILETDDLTFICMVDDPKHASMINQRVEAHRVTNKEEVSRQESNDKRTPSAFISYSWDSEEHRQWVVALATRLRENGVDVILDRWHLALGAEKTLFMEMAVRKSDHVLLICTPQYKEKAESRLGGVGWETSIVTAELADDLTQTKFIPVLRQGSFQATLPVWVKNRVGVDLSADPYSEKEFQLLLRDLHGAAMAPPPLGPTPVFRDETSAASKTAPTGAVECEFSPRAQLLSKDLSMRAFPVVQECSWSEQIELTVLAETREIDAIFSRLRGHKEHLVVAYGFDVAIAKLTALNRVASGGKALWRANFEPTRTEFSNDMEMGTSSTTADEFAEKRVRRLLLNENPMSFKSPKEDFIGLANEMMSENLVQGLNSVVKIEHSPFLDLHSAFGHDPQSFIEIAWIAAVTDLKLSAAVEHIYNLALGLVEDTMAVDFAGRRHRKYVNVPPYEIKAQGTVRVAAESEVAQDPQVINDEHY